MTVLDQALFNWVLGIISLALGSILTAVWAAVKDLQRSDKELAEKVAAINVLVVGEYVKRGEMSAVANALFAKLDRIEDKLDGKADKHKEGGE